MLTNHTCSLLFVGLPLAILVAPEIAAQTQPATLADTVIATNHPEVKAMLAQPNGLAAAAKQVGRLVIDADTTVSQSLTLPAISSASDVAVLCRIVEQSVQVNQMSNIVTTAVRVHVDEIMKGTPPTDLLFTVPGGRIVFDSDAFADVRTSEMRSIGKGLEMLLFLNTTSSAGSYTLTNGLEGMFWVSLSDGIVTSSTKYDIRHQHLLQSTSMTLAALRSQLFGFDGPRPASSATTPKK